MAIIGPGVNLDYLKDQQIIELAVQRLNAQNPPITDPEKRQWFLEDEIDSIYLQRLVAKDPGQYA